MHQAPTMHSTARAPGARGGIERGRTAGMTLIEIAIVVGLTGVVALTLGNVLIGTTQTVDFLMRDSLSIEEMQDTVNQIKEEIRDSSSANVVVQTGSLSDTLFVQEGRYDDYANTMSYGVEDDSGYWQSGWRVRYSVTGTNLIRDVMPGGSTVVSSSEIVATDLDMGGGGTKGFTVIQNGDLYVVRIAINETYDDGKTCKKTLQSTVLLQN